MFIDVSRAEHGFFFHFRNKKRSLYFKVRRYNLFKNFQSIQQMGNSRARAVYEANLPDSFRRPQTDCSLESFIRAKYEHKKYIAREWVPPPLPKVIIIFDARSNLNMFHY